MSLRDQARRRLSIRDASHPLLLQILRDCCELLQRRFQVVDDFLRQDVWVYFQYATLENVLAAVSALLIANIYFANANGSLKDDLVPSKLLLPRKLIKAAKPGFSALKLKMP
jgi:hypothetical protein